MAGGRNSKGKVGMAERRTLALNLRRDGASYRLIAMTIERQLGIRYTESQAYTDIDKEMERINQQCAETAAAVRTLELERLDQYLLQISPEIKKGNLKAIDRALRIGERRSKLLGLDAPIEFKVQELVQAKVSEEVNMLFEQIASDPDIPAEAKQKVFAAAAQLQERSSVAGEN